MTKEEKQAVKNSNKYCFFTTSCPDTQKPMYLLSSYKCCNQCKNKNCTARCCDKYEDCRLATTKEELLKISTNIKLSEEDVKLFPHEEANSPTSGKPEKAVDKKQESKPAACPAPPVAMAAKKVQKPKQETKKQETTLSISQIAKMLNVSYDKVAYLVKIKKLTPQQALDKLKEKK